MSALSNDFFDLSNGLATLSSLRDIIWNELFRDRFGDVDESLYEAATDNHVYEHDISPTTSTTSATSSSNTSPSIASSTLNSAESSPTVNDDAPTLPPPIFTPSSAANTANTEVAPSTQNVKGKGRAEVEADVDVPGPRNQIGHPQASSLSDEVVKGNQALLWPTTQVAPLSAQNAEQVFGKTSLSQDRTNSTSDEKNISIGLVAIPSPLVPEVSNESPLSLPPGSTNPPLVFTDEQLTPFDPQSYIELPEFGNDHISDEQETSREDHPQFHIGHVLPMLPMFRREILPAHAHTSYQASSSSNAYDMAPRMNLAQSWHPVHGDAVYGANNASHRWGGYQPSVQPEPSSYRAPVWTGYNNTAPQRYPLYIPQAEEYQETALQGLDATSNFSTPNTASSSTSSSSDTPSRVFNERRRIQCKTEPVECQGEGCNETITASPVKRVRRTPNITLFIDDDGKESCEVVKDNQAMSWPTTQAATRSDRQNADQVLGKRRLSEVLDNAASDEGDTSTSLVATPSLLAPEISNESPLPTNPPLVSVDEQGTALEDYPQVYKRHMLPMLPMSRREILPAHAQTSYQASSSHSTGYEVESHMNLAQPWHPRHGHVHGANDASYHAAFHQWGEYQHGYSAPVRTGHNDTAPQGYPYSAQPGEYQETAPQGLDATSNVSTPNTASSSSSSSSTTPMCPFKKRRRIQFKKEPMACQWDGCNETITASPEAAVKHMREAHNITYFEDVDGNKVWECRWAGCGQILAKESGLSKHINNNSHTGYDQVVCEFCDKTVARFELFKSRHLECHAGMPKEGGRQKKRQRLLK